jgi:uncharacterized cupredoxin-like copper-binding protein
MKTKHLIAIASSVLWASSILASGNHAGGHGDSSAIGKAGKLTDVKRTITVEMLDSMRFNPSHITVKRGETIQFIVKNNGKLKHEMVLGSDRDLKAHYELMKKMPEMEHDEPNQISLASGKSGEIIWQFTKAGKVDFGCLQVGHYEAGMKGAVTVGGKKISHNTH